MSQPKAQVRLTSVEEVRHLAMYERHAAIMRADEAKKRGNIKLQQKEIGYSEAYDAVLSFIGEESE